MGLAIICGVLVAAVLLAGFALPKHVVIGRRVIIDAPPELVAPDLAAVAAWPDWGTPVISKNDPAKGLEYKLELGGGQVIDGRVHFTRDGTRTAVAWVDRLDVGHSYVGRYIGATMDMRLGPRIEQSLLELKKRAEERAAAKGVVAHSAPPVHDAALTPPPEEKHAAGGETPPAPAPAPAPAPEQPAPTAPPVEAPPAPAPAVEKPVEKPAESAPPPAAEPPKAEEAPPKQPEEPAPGP